MDTYYESVLTGHRDGETYDPQRDYQRLNRQMLHVYVPMSDAQWHTLYQIRDYLLQWAGIIDIPPHQSISARLRDFRKKRFGSHTVLKESMGGGMWMYRLIWNPEVERPTQTEINKAFEPSL